MDIKITYNMADTKVDFVSRHGPATVSIPVPKGKAILITNINVCFLDSSRNVYGFSLASIRI